MIANNDGGPIHPDIRKALQLLERDMDHDLVVVCDKLVRAGTHVWVLDPEVDNVVGLVRTDNRRKAVVVVYVADGDFEANDELWEAL